jgi:hypothetical protein
MCMLSLCRVPSRTSLRLHAINCGVCPCSTRFERTTHFAVKLLQLVRGLGSIECVCHVHVCECHGGNAAVASGTASVMGAPVGALLFSIEITASYYLIRCLCSHYTLACVASQLVHRVMCWKCSAIYGVVSCAPSYACSRFPSSRLSRCCVAGRWLLVSPGITLAGSPCVA